MQNAPSSPASARRSRFFFWAIFLVGFGLRVGLAFVNRQANDDHYQEIIVPLLKGWTPTKGLAAYHPFLYHRTAVFLMETLGVTWDHAQVRIAQELNAVVGGLTLVLLYFFLMRLRLPEAVSRLTFLFFSLNPGLIAINAMASNDTFVIFFSSLVCVAVFLIVSQPEAGLSFRRGLLFLVAGLGLFLSIYSKGNGLVMAVWVCLFFLMSSLLALFTRSSLKTSLAGLGLLLAVSVAAVALNPVYFTHKAYEMLVVSRELYLGKFSGKMRVIPSQSAEGKALLSETFLSFPLYSLLEHPTNPTLKTKMDHTSLPVAHMRSYWAQVYGNAVFTRFHNWPPTWRRATPGALWLGRVLLVLNLLPLMVFFIGLGRLAILGWHEVSRRRMGENTFFLGTDLGHVAAGVRYAMIYPGPAFSKFIYVAPFLPAAAAAFSSGLQLVRDRLPRLFLVLEMTIYAIAALDIVDVVWLARDLSNFLST